MSRTIYSLMHHHIHVSRWSPSSAPVHLSLLLLLCRGLLNVCRNHCIYFSSASLYIYRIWEGNLIKCSQASYGSQLRWLLKSSGKTSLWHHFAWCVCLDDYKSIEEIIIQKQNTIIPVQLHQWQWLVLLFTFLLYSCVVAVYNFWQEFVPLLRLSINELDSLILQCFVPPFIHWLVGGRRWWASTRCLVQSLFVNSVSCGTPFPGQWGSPNIKNSFRNKHDSGREHIHVSKLLASCSACTTTLVSFVGRAFTHTNQVKQSNTVRACLFQ